MRMLVIGVFAFALAEPRSVRTSDTLSVVYAIDLSDSIGEGSSDQALQFLTQTVTQKPEKDQAGLVVFGRNAAAELPPRQAFPVRVAVDLDQLPRRPRCHQHRAGPLAGRGHAARGQPRADRPRHRRHADRREPVSRSSTISRPATSPSTCCRSSSTTTMKSGSNGSNCPSSSRSARITRRSSSSRACRMVPGGSSSANRTA